MELIFKEIKVGVEEKFFYDPNEIMLNVCSICARNKDCPVTCKDIVNNCNSYEWVKTEPNPIATNWRVIQGMTLSNNNHAYVSNCAS